MQYLLFAAVHMILCLLIFLGIRFRVLSVHKYMFFVALLLPFWGILIVLLLHFHIGFNPSGTKEIGIDQLKLESEIYRSVAPDDKHADRTVPIEEALLIDSAKERRSLIMDVLNDNPGEYVEFLRKAGNNDDTEIVHYAVTAMVEISKENDYMLQKLETAYSSDPNNISVLTEYCDFLWSCLSQNLMQGQVEVMNRELFSQLMNKKIAISGNVTDYARLVENELKRSSFDKAEDILSKMSVHWPDSEEYILLQIQYYASLGKGQEIRAFIRQLEDSNMYISSKTKEALSFWAN